MMLFGIFFMFGFYISATAQVQKGTPCETPQQQYGLCVEIKQCKYLLDILRAGITAEIATYLRSFSCGFSGNTPLVCCPQTNVRNPIDDVEVPIDQDQDDDNKQIGEPVQLSRSPDCGFSNVSFPRIVGGLNAKLGGFPWMVALGYKNSKIPDQPKWLCGGTLITQRHVLTAAHCVSGRRDLYLVRLGELDLYDDNDGAYPENIPIKSSKVHEAYSATQFTDDIAILTLERKTDNPTVRPICLPWEREVRTKDFIGFRLFVVGWGSLYFNGPSSSILQQVMVPVIDNDNCKRAFMNRTVIDDRIMCAGYLMGGKDACKGDSGGPLMYGKNRGHNSTFYLLGVVSYGYRCAEEGYPGVYTRVTHYIEWIQKNLLKTKCQGQLRGQLHLRKPQCFATA
ncbi:venom protease-like isoform X2 [Cylas formicarius]|uniref:venom protease-like isoform X2 n=1 Tax=Cylas formicarius TaxID=197179 RepID=UPI002958ABA4|nr:venom protease-like isoform X2 [Cylas formicarius]